MADAQAEPLLDKLKSDPNNPELLTGIGNIYYDAQQYPIAVDYYGRTLKINPSDTAVRTDMATAYWYMGKADLAIEEFNKALIYAPNNPEHALQPRPGQVAGEDGQRGRDRRLGEAAGGQPKL